MTCGWKRCFLSVVFSVSYNSFRYSFSNRTTISFFVRRKGGSFSVVRKLVQCLCKFSRKNKADLELKMKPIPVVHLANIKGSIS
ncbi:hypothetical protein Barb4_01257 [Bacteroidales bacterium Barb4]|nr:hypothetical protein Barb4_01257 [Bacteroidales bacterium Barb4]